MSHKAQQIILHFGLAKTGSTAIQRALFDQKTHLLQNQKVLYPGQEENHFHLQSLFSNNPETLIQIQRLGLPNDSAITSFLNNYRKSLLIEISESKPQRIVISSEYFSGMSIAELQAMCSFLETIAEEILLFAYLRDPWSFAISHTQEMIRAGMMNEPVKFGYAKSNIEIFNKFEDAFGNCLTIAPYIAGDSRIDVVSDFCERIGIELISRSSDHNEAKQPLNTKMTREAASAMLHLNRLYPTFDKDDNFMQDGSRDWMIEALQETSQQTSKISISKTSARNIYERARSDIDYIEQKYFSGDRAFTQLYSTMQNDDFDDDLSVSNLSQERLVSFMLSAMRILSNRAIYYNEHMMKNSMERIVWEGKYHACIGDLIHARQCFENVLEIDPLHDEAKRQIDELNNAAPI